MTTPLWTADEIAAATGGAVRAAFSRRRPAPPSTPARSSPATSSSPSRARPGTGTISCRDALEKGAAAAVVAEDRAAEFADAGPLIVVPRRARRHAPARRAARTARGRASIVAITGSVGKTGTKEAMRLALVAPGRDARLRRLLQQPLGRAADAGAHAARHRLRRLRDRHEPCRRDPAADRPWSARTSPSITTIEPVHIEYLPLDLGHRRRQGRDLLGPRAGRHRGDQPRQPLFRAPARPCPGLAGRPRRHLRRASRRRTCAPSASS